MKWRAIDTTALTGSQLQEFTSDQQESNRRYDIAFSSVLQHTSTSELEAFWRPFGVAAPSGDRMTQEEWEKTNPVRRQISSLQSQNSFLSFQIRRFVSM